jgi:hypothetical protein
MSQSNNRPRYFLSSYDAVFWSIVIAGVLVIAASYPMMKLRFDIWDHVDRIRSMVIDSSAPSPAKRYWYACWAFVFRLFNITDVFIIGTVVHRAQFIVNCVLIYFAAQQVFAPLLSLSKYEPTQKQWLSSLALSSVAVWLTIIGTYSFFQQAWIMWYSVNYQITLSMLFLALAFTVNILAMPQVMINVLIKACMALGLLLLVLMFHAGELAYLGFYLPILILCFGSKLSYKPKYVLAVGAMLLVAVYLSAKFYADQTPALITHLINRDFIKILQEIKVKGTWNAIHGGNRYAANWNELYALSVYLLFAIGIAVHTPWLKNIAINKRVLWFLLLSLIFCFAPTFVYTSGVLSLVSYDGIVNRYYFASFVYTAVPLVVYIGLKYLRVCKHPIWLFVFVVLLMLGVFIYSKINRKEGVYYQNVQSIITSIQAKRVNIDVHDDEVESIRSQLIAAEKKYASNDFVYCGAYESLHLTYYFFQKKNLYFYRMGNHALADCYWLAKRDQKHVVYLY